jgi:hypothetical protein
MIHRRSRAGERTSSPSPQDAAALDTAWRIHQAQGEWTSRVDAKAAFAFTIEAAAIATTVALTADGRILSDLDKWWLIALYALGLGLLLVAAGFAALVVIPRLRRSKVEAEAPDNFIYFGHARFWNPKELERAIREEPVLPQLARQIVTMAQIAWVKHMRVQSSFSLAIIGAVILVFCGLIRTF